MTTPTSVFTPQSVTSASSAASASTHKPSPGSWRHPKFDEIAQRQRANTFNDSNIRRIFYNGLATALLAYIYLHPITARFLADPSVSVFLNPVLVLLGSVLLYNIFAAFLPLIRTPDNLDDIPLTPTQRSLLGLSPDATPPMSPGTLYITPPRYQRSTPGSTGGSASRSTSTSLPTSQRGSPSTAGGASATDRGDSPTASPLWQKTRELARKGSQGRPSPLGPGTSIERSRISSSTSLSGTPSPKSGSTRNASGLNSKWLYENGRRSSGVF